MQMGTTLLMQMDPSYAGLPDQTPDVQDLDYPLVFAKEARKKKGKMSTEEPTTTAVPVRKSRSLAGGAPEFGLLDSERLLRKEPLATGLVPLEDDDGIRVSYPGRKRKADGSLDVSPPTDRPETRSPLKRPALASAAVLALVPTTPLARTGTDHPTLTLARTGTDDRESDDETLERYSIPVPAPLVETAEGLLRAAETHESRRQDEFQKALTYLRDCYTRELDVARAQVTNEANEALLREAEKNALSWEDRTRELQGQLALKWEQREALLVWDRDSDLLVARR
ncbi:hypothetical protein DYB31_012301, partial [Aphanomyces astaci]